MVEPVNGLLLVRVDEPDVNRLEIYNILVTRFYALGLDLTLFDDLLLNHPRILVYAYLQHRRVPPDHKPLIPVSDELKELRCIEF